MIETQRVIRRSVLRLANEPENVIPTDIKEGERPKTDPSGTTPTRPIFISEHEGKVMPTIDLSKTPFAVQYDGIPSTPPPNGEKVSDTTPHNKPPIPAESDDGNTPDTAKPMVESETIESPPTKPAVESENQISPPATSPKEIGESKDNPNDSIKSKRRLNPLVETVSEDQEQDEQFPSDKEVNQDSEHVYQEIPSSMGNTPMKDMPESDGVDIQDVSEPSQPRRKFGETNPDNDPVDLRFKNMENPNPTLGGLSPNEMIGRTFLLPPEEDGTRHRAKVIQQMEETTAALADNPEIIKFRCLVNNEKEDIISYNDIINHIEDDETFEELGLSKIAEILNHSPEIKNTKYNRELEDGHMMKYNDSSYNVLVKWEDGSTSWQPLSNKRKWGIDAWGVMDTDPVTVALYAQKAGMLLKPGWGGKRIRDLVKTQKRLIRNVNQAKLHSLRNKPIYMYGYQVPRGHQQAMELDQENGNTKWRDSEKKELGQIDDYETFLNMGKGYKPGPDYKRINVHIVYAVKHDGRHKARLVAGGHLTDTPIDSVYSSVMSLQGVRILTFLAELNELESWATDIGNAYLESFTKEKVYIIAGPEFGEREGCTLIIRKALYGLKSSGLRWHERLANVLTKMGFVPSKAEPDVWF